MDLMSCPRLPLEKGRDGFNPIICYIELVTCCIVGRAVVLYNKLSVLPRLTTTKRQSIAQYDNGQERQYASRHHIF